MSIIHRGHSRRIASLATAALLIAAPAGAAHASVEPTTAHAPTEATASPTTFRVATSGFVDSFNPFTSIYLTPTGINRYVYENLVQYDAEDGSPTKGLADSWETDEDGATWTFTLQDDLVWSDGEPITADDVVYTYTQMMEVPELAVANGGLVSNFDSVEAPDEKTVVVHLTEPQASNPGVEIPIVPEHVWAELDNAAEYSNDKEVVGSGPYLLESYEANQQITLKANPDFWQGEPAVERIQYVYYTNSDAQVQALRSGEVDFVSGLSPSQYQALEGADGITVHSGEGRRYSSISINSGLKTRDGEPYGNGHVALQDREVRQALRLGTDTQALVDNVLEGFGVKATTFIPAAYSKWALPEDDPVLADYDPEAAAQKLDDAGWVVGSDGIREKDGEKLELRLLVDADSLEEQSTAEYFVPWMEEIGVKINVESTDVDTISANTFLGDYDMYFSGWSINPDPDYQLGINLCSTLPTNTDGTGGTTQDGYCNPEFDEMYAQQRSELDEGTREQIVHDMLALNYEDAPQITTWYPNSLEAYRSDRFDGFTLQPKDGGVISGQAGYWGFLTMEPADDAAAQDDGGAPTGLIVTGAVIAVLIIGGVVFVLVRRRRSADLE